MIAPFLLLIAFIPMLAEAARSMRNEQALRAAGATEPPDDVFGVMQWAYPACFLAMSAEAWLRHRQLTPIAIAGGSVFIVAKALKYWAVATLGGRWTFRVLVPPDSRRISSGPYRWVRHPNYVAVMGELLGMALMAQSQVAGALSLVGFGLLILKRVRVEERALG